jgi:cell division protein FtsL
MASPASAAPERAPRAARRLRPNLRIVRVEGVSRRARLTRMLGLATVAGIFGVLFGLAAFHAELAQGQYQLDELERRLVTLTEQRTELELEAEELESPDRIAAIARDLIGMVSPETVHDIYPSPKAAAGILGESEQAHDTPGAQAAAGSPEP